MFPQESRVRSSILDDFGLKLVTPLQRLVEYREWEMQALEGRYLENNIINKQLNVSSDESCEVDKDELEKLVKISWRG